MRAHIAEVVAAIPGSSVVGEAGDVDSALVGILTAAPDVVILDVEFPGGGGRRLIERLDHEARRPVVLVLTNHSEPEYRAAFLRCGAAGFFDKALELPALIAELRRRAGGLRL